MHGRGTPAEWAPLLQSGATAFRATTSGRSQQLGAPVHAAARGSAHNRINGERQVGFSTLLESKKSIHIFRVTRHFL